MQRASARGTVMASSPSRKRLDEGTRPRTEAPIRKQSEAVYCQVSGLFGRLRNQVKSRESERRGFYLWQLEGPIDACVHIFPPRFRLEVHLFWGFLLAHTPPSRADGRQSHNFKHTRGWTTPTVKISPATMSTADEIPARWLRSLRKSGSSWSRPCLLAMA